MSSPWWLVEDRGYRLDVRLDYWLLSCFQVAGCWWSVFQICLSGIINHYDHDNIKVTGDYLINYYSRRINCCINQCLKYSIMNNDHISARYIISQLFFLWINWLSVSWCEINIISTYSLHWYTFSWILELWYLSAGGYIYYTVMYYLQIH